MPTTIRSRSRPSDSSDVPAFDVVDGGKDLHRVQEGAPKAIVELATKAAVFFGPSMKRISFENMQCSIAQTLEVVGEWWTLLVLREVFFGRRRFAEMLDDLGIARNILTDRLNKLVDQEILVRHQVIGIGGRPEYHEYRLTDQGRELFSVLVALMQWGDRWRKLPKGAPTELVHRTCNHKTTPALICSHCGEPLSASNVLARPGRGFRHDTEHPLVRAKTASS